MKIGYMTLDWSTIKDRAGHPTPGGAGWYRCALPAKYLAQNGIQTVLGGRCKPNRDGSLAVIDWNGIVHTDCDVIVMQRWMEATVPIVIELAKAAGQVIINDVDDHFDGIDPSNLAFYHSHPKANPKSNRIHYQRALASSSALTVSTKFLERKLERLGVKIFHVPNAIDLDRWEVQDVSGDPMIGWVGVTGFRSGDLEILRGVLEPLLRRNPQVHFHHSGCAARLPQAWEKLGLSRVSSATRMDSILAYPSLFQWFNIGIVPLADKPFNQAKSCIKGIEYGASGIPSVASSTEEYDALRCLNGTYTARKAKDWLKLLPKLFDESERIRSGKIARSAVEAHFDMAKNWENWLLAYKSALADNQY